MTGTAWFPETVPEISAQLWSPVVETYDPATGIQMGVTSYCRWEAVNAAKAAIARGRAVVILDACPTCASKVVFVGGPSSPLTNAWRRPRGR